MVAILTESEYLEILGKEYKDGMTFNPIKDKNDNWVISEQEIVQCDNELFLYLKDKNLIIFEPKESIIERF